MNTTLLYDHSTRLMHVRFWLIQNQRSFSYMRRFTSTLQAWHKIVLFSVHVQINLEKLITSS